MTDVPPKRHRSATHLTPSQRVEIGQELKQLPSYEAKQELCDKHKISISSGYRYMHEAENPAMTKRHRNKRKRRGAHPEAEAHLATIVRYCIA